MFACNFALSFQLHVFLKTMALLQKNKIIVNDLIAKVIYMK